MTNSERLKFQMRSLGALAFVATSVTCVGTSGSLLLNVLQNHFQNTPLFVIRANSQSSFRVSIRTTAFVSSGRSSLAIPTYFLITTQYRIEPVLKNKIESEAVQDTALIKGIH